MPVERVRGERPDDPQWRADGLAGSRHTRLLDELREPLEDHDPERSRSLCAEVTRRALLDFAPAVIPLPAAERERCQALAALTLTLFDFAQQTALEGERLSQINRWEFNLELALEGDPPGQPVFVQMAAAEASRPWPRPALDELFALARRRATVPASTREAAAGERQRLAGALCGALLPEPPAAETSRLVDALLGVHSLQELGEAQRRGRRELVAGSERDDIGGAIRGEAQALRSALAPAAGVRALPAGYRRSAAYSRRAGLALLDRIERLGGEILEHPPRLGAAARVGCLLKALLLRR